MLDFMATEEQASPRVKLNEQLSPVKHSNTVPGNKLDIIDEEDVDY